jgi:CRP/FNR family transcriptional activator FtrB
MRKDDLDIVRSLPLFAELSEAGLAAVTAGAFLQRFPAGVTLVEEGERADFLHVIVAGGIELYGRHGERTSTLALLSAGQTFILAAVVANDVYLKSARTILPSRILMIPAEPLRAVLDSEARFAHAVVQELAQRYRGLVRSLKSQRLRTGTERLAAWILNTDAANGGSGRFRIEVEKRLLASLLGMTPENLSRAFAALATAGLETSGREVHIQDRPALVEIAKPSSLMD